MARAKTQRLPVVGTAELVHLLDVSQPRVYQLVHSRGFPAPWVRLRATQVWLMEDIERWAEQQKRTLRPLPVEWATRGTPGAKGREKRET